MATGFKPRWLALSVNWLLVSIGCAAPGAASSRYTLARDPGSRSDTRYVMDKETHQWVQRECELRVSVDRKIPNPLLEPGRGNRLSVQLKKPGSAQSGGLMSLDFETRDGFRVWNIRDVMREADTKEGTAYIVTISWPHEGQATEYDPNEIFPMPAPGNIIPNTWSEWRTASSLRAGAFGWWNEVQGVRLTADEIAAASAAASAAGASSIPPYPFEMRCRLLVVKHPVNIP